MTAIGASARRNWLEFSVPAKSTETLAFPFGIGLLTATSTGRKNAWLAAARPPDWVLIAHSSSALDVHGSAAHESTAKDLRSVALARSHGGRRGAAREHLRILPGGHPGVSRPFGIRRAGRGSFGRSP